MPNRRTSAAAVGRGIPAQRGGCIGRALSGSWVSACAVPGFISTLVYRAPGAALQSSSAITRHATKSTSTTHKELLEGCPQLSSMAYRSRRAACMSNSPMTAKRTMCALSLGRRDRHWAKSGLAENRLGVVLSRIVAARRWKSIPLSCAAIRSARCATITGRSKN